MFGPNPNLRTTYGYEAPITSATSSPTAIDRSENSLTSGGFWSDEAGMGVEYGAQDPPAPGQTTNRFVADDCQGCSESTTRHPRESRTANPGRLRYSTRSSGLA